ncbi:MAG TPA: hypothetical protein DCS43_11140 [Verrucomicrobia bacterium]|nr:hypothetical protein [Verrucomicrobiota bacterium]
MKTPIIYVVALAASVLTASQAHSQQHALTLGGRYHARHTSYTELPYDKGDLSAVVGYEYHEAMAFWQLLVGYTPEVSEGDDGRGLGVDDVITPQINLLFKENNWAAGVGALASYIEYEDKELDDWTDVYWQVMFGYQIPLPAFRVELMLYYPFEKWKNFSDFDARDLEFGLMLRRMF